MSYTGVVGHTDDDSPTTIPAITREVVLCRSVFDCADVSVIRESKKMDNAGRVMRGRRMGTSRAMAEVVDREERGGIRLRRQACCLMPCGAREPWRWSSRNFFELALTSLVRLASAA